MQDGGKADSAEGSPTIGLTSHFLILLISGHLSLILATMLALEIRQIDPARDVCTAFASVLLLAGAVFGIVNAMTTEQVAATSTWRHRAPLMTWAYVGAGSILAFAATLV